MEDNAKFTLILKIHHFKHTTSNILIEAACFYKTES